MTRTHGQVEALWEDSGAERKQGRHFLRLKKSHQACRETAQNADPTETFGERQLVRHPSMPCGVLPTKKLHTPGRGPPAQPTVFWWSSAWDGGVGDTKFPVRLASHIDLPVMAATGEALHADDVEGGVEASG